MKCSSLELLALSVLLILILTPGCATRFVPPTPELPPITPAECLRLCPPMPEPSEATEVAHERWKLKMVHWGEVCASIPKDCVEALEASE